MRKRVRQLKTNQVSNPSLEELLNSYDRASLMGMISSFENSEAWTVFQAYARLVQRQYEVEALDAMGREGAVKSASFASGYAKGVEDVTEKFMEGLRKTVSNVSMVVENPRPEVDEIVEA